MPIAAIAVAPIVGVLLMSTTVIGIATPTTTTTTPLVLAMPTTTRPSSAPTTSTTRPSTTTPLPTIPPAIVQPTTTAPPTITAQPSTTTAAVPTAPATTAPAPATTTTQLLIHDVFVSAVDVGQVEQDVDSRMPLVAGKSSTWVRVATHHAGGGDAGTIDGALLVERDGQRGDADDRPPDVAPSELPRSGYLAPITWVDGAVALEVVSLTDGTVLDSMRLDSEAPVAPESVDVNAGTVDNNETITIHGNRTETVSWELAASGGVAAEQTFDVLWSNDGFATSIPVAVGVTGSEVMLQNTSYFPAGDNVQVRVVPGGVMHTDNGDDGTTSEPFSVPAGPPLVAVAGAPDEPVEHGDPIDLHAIVVQPPTTGDGDVDASDFIIWHDQFDGRLFEGQLLTARDLRPGTHTIGMNIDSPDGGEATAEVVFDIVAEPSPTPSGDALDPVSARLVPADLEPTSIGATPAGPWPGPQSCGSNECVGDFIAACEEAGGLPMDVGPVPPSPDGVEVECQQISTEEE
jgi:hypothetical protein